MLVRLGGVLQAGIRLSLIGCFGAMLTPTGLAATPCPGLANQIDAVIDQAAFRRSRWGVLIQTLGSQPQTLYERSADQFFIPASNVKLLTTAAALTQLGADFRIRTSIDQIRDAASDQVQLHLMGQGDPSIDQPQLETLVQQLVDRDIRQIDQLVVDDRYFRGEAVNPNWEWEDVQAGYGAPVNSLIFAQNWIGLTLIPQALQQPLQVQWDDPRDGRGWQIVNRSQTVATQMPEFVAVGRDLSRPILYVQGQLRAGSASEQVAIAEPQPAQRFLDRLLQTLAARQITVHAIELIPDSQTVERMENSSSLELLAPREPIAQIESAPLRELLTEINQHSNNLYAEAILRVMGNRAEPRTGSSLESGLSTLKQSLTQLEVDPEGYELVDGSGLARQNLSSPRAIVQTLQAMNQTTDAALYRNSLSVAGINGSLAQRFQDTTLDGQLQGKSGFLTGVVALSGYLEQQDGTELVFSILVNHTTQPLGATQAAIDSILLTVAQSACFSGM